jgi:hypothetical protein
MDILPTIAEITDIDITDYPPIDGSSILGLMSGPVNTRSPTDYFVYYDSADDDDDDDGDGYPDIRAVRDARGCSRSRMRRATKSWNFIICLTISRP